MEKPLAKMREQLQIEVDAAYLYQKLAEHYGDPLICDVFRKMADIERGHAEKALHKIRVKYPDATMPDPSLRARIQVKLGKIFGFDFIVSNLSALEWQISKAAQIKKQQKGEKITGLENLHLNIIDSLSRQKNLTIGGSLLSKIEGKHKSVGGNELRAAVLGANDGLVSNMSLVMGVAGATHGQTEVLIAGIAGVIAGSISMALGEWLSVQSSRELYQKQIEIEEEELESSPEEEMKELILLYQAKGIREQEATRLAEEVFANKEAALDSLVREELGIDKDMLGGSAWKAAITSFCLFAFGAIIPVLPFFFIHSEFKATVTSLALGTLALFGIGSAITLFTGRGVFYSGARQVLFGLTAAIITYGIGRLIAQSLT